LYNAALSLKNKTKLNKRLNCALLGGWEIERSDFYNVSAFQVVSSFIAFA
jgi:hypothetical protein